MSKEAEITRAIRANRIDGVPLASGLVLKDGRRWSWLVHVPSGRKWRTSDLMNYRCGDVVVRRVHSLMFPEPLLGLIRIGCYE